MGALVEASWKLTFKSAHMMLESASAAPRLVQEVTGLYKSAIDALREGLASSDGASLKAVEATASQQKLETILTVMTSMQENGGGGGGGGGGAGPNSLEAANKMAANTSRNILGAMTEDDLPVVLQHPLGRALAVVSDWAELQQTIKGLFEAVTTGDLQLSDESKAAARKVVQAINA